MRQSERTYLLSTGNSRGFALPAILFMIVILIGVTTILAVLSSQGFKRVSSEQGILNTNFVSEGVIHYQLSQMSLYGNLWDQQPTISTKPSGYTQFTPVTYTSTNGVPNCSTGVACQRNYYPLGGGLVKNFGPLNGSGASVDSSYSIANQLNYSSLPSSDVSLASLNGWVQVERLDESTPSASSVGGNLSSSLAEGGNAKKVRYRLSGTAVRKVAGRTGLATVVSVVEVPVM